MSSACIVDVAGAVLSLPERRLFSRLDPWAFILFKRSCESPAQVRALCEDLRDSVGRNCLIFIDQEGGRVQRLAPPIWPQFPAPAFFGDLWAKNREDALKACRLSHHLMAHTMHKLGITATCAPCLDRQIAGASQVIGDRAFSTDPAAIAELGAEALGGLADGGVAAVLKHAPGMGRSLVDSHFHLPHVDATKEELAGDLVPFAALNQSAMWMVGHVIYSAIDGEYPASLSKKVIGTLLRDELGFDGLLMPDDLTMKALAGDAEANAREAFDAGMDVALRCHGTLDERAAFIEACPSLSGNSLARAVRAESSATHPMADFDEPEAWAKLGEFSGWTREIITSISSDPTKTAWV